MTEEQQQFGGQRDQVHGRGGGMPPPRLPKFEGKGPGKARVIAALVLAMAIVYGSYFWIVRRVVVGPGHVLVLMKKDGSRSLPGDQVVIPRMPDPDKDSAAYAEWRKKFGDVNGIVEQVYRDDPALIATAALDLLAPLDRVAHHRGDCLEDVGYFLGQQLLLLGGHDQT